MQSLLTLCLLPAVAVLAQDSFNVHLALSSDPTRMFVSWRSSASDSSAAVQWGSASGKLTESANASSWTFTDSSTGRAYFMHKATMTGLTPGAQVFYSAGSSGVEHSFTATRSPSQFSESAPLRLAWFGDLGWQNAQALDYLVKDAAKGLYDAQIHVGGEACLGSGALHPSGLRKCVAHPSFPPLPCYFPPHTHTDLHYR